MTLRIFLADLTHDTVGLATEVFPLNIGFVGAYCKERFGDAVDVTLFKYVRDLEEAIYHTPLMVQRLIILLLMMFVWVGCGKEDVGSETKGGRVGIVTASKLNLRQKPGGKIISSLKLNTEVEILSEFEGWLKVKLDNQIGYVSSDYITRRETKSRSNADKINRVKNGVLGFDNTLILGDALYLFRQKVIQHPL